MSIGVIIINTLYPNFENFIFLDIDGVLNNQNEKDRKVLNSKEITNNMYDTMISKSNFQPVMRLLCWMLDNNFKLVISSDWRVDAELELTRQLQCLFGHYLIDQILYGFTPVHNFNDGIERRTEIYEFIENSKCNKYLIIDDDNIDNRFRDMEFYQTNSLTGLTDSNVDEIILRLTGKHPKLIEKDDMDFLKELGHELKVQDNRITAKPIVFQILNYTYEPAYVDCGDCYEVFMDGERIGNYEKTSESYEEFVKDMINEFQEGTEWEPEEWEEFYETIFYFNDFYDWKDILEYELNIYLYESNKTEHLERFFLTDREARKHLKNNYYHYHKDAVTYATHGWRTPELEKLLNIVEKIGEHYEE